MNVKDPIRKRLNKGFLVISIVCCIGLVISDIALFAMSTSYNHAMANYGFSQGEIGKSNDSIFRSKKFTQGCYRL